AEGTRAQLAWKLLRPTNDDLSDVEERCVYVRSAEQMQCTLCVHARPVVKGERKLRPPAARAIDGDAERREARKSLLRSRSTDHRPRPRRGLRNRRRGAPVSAAPEQPNRNAGGAEEQSGDPEHERPPAKTAA